MKQEIKKNADVYCKTYAVNMWERKRRNKQWENRGDIRLAKVSTGLEIIIKTTMKMLTCGQTSRLLFALSSTMSSGDPALQLTTSRLDRWSGRRTHRRTGTDVSRAPVGLTA